MLLNLLMSVLSCLFTSLSEIPSSNIRKCVLILSVKAPEAMRLTAEELGRPPFLKRDEPDPVSNSRQLGVRRIHCIHVIMVVWSNPLLCIELMHHQV